MKILTVLGTRPEIIRLSRVIEKLDRLCEHVLVHTGQNYDPNLNDIFFQQLGVRQPNHFLGVRGDTLGEQIGKIIATSERVMLDEKPDRVLMLGDTNSSLAAVVAKRLGIPVYHMEAGNRCYDDRVPEEVNRRIIDHSSDILMPYTERSRANLLREGFEGYRIFVTGNPILEVIQHYDSAIRQSDVLQRLGLTPGKYFLVTMHREENVDVEARLRSLTQALELLQKEYRLPVICSVHPRTKNRMQRFGVGETNQAGPPDTNSAPFRIQDYGQTAVQLEGAARQLTELLHTLDQIIDSTNLASLAARVSPVVQQAQTGGKEVVNYAFWKGILLVAIACAALLVTVLLHRFLSARLARPAQR